MYCKLHLFCFVNLKVSAWNGFPNVWQHLQILNNFFFFVLKKNISTFKINRYACATYSLCWDYGSRVVQSLHIVKPLQRWVCFSVYKTLHIVAGIKSILNFLPYAFWGEGRNLMYAAKRFPNSKNKTKNSTDYTCLLIRHNRTMLWRFVCFIQRVEHLTFVLLLWEFGFIFLINLFQTLVYKT